jgi:hypothetical protein
LGYDLLLYAHILSVVVSVGPFFVLIPMVKKFRTAEGAELQAYLSTFKFAIRMAKHAGHVLVLSGVGLALAGSWPWNTPWLDMTVLILISSLLFLARAFSPKLRELVSPNHDREKVVRSINRGVWIYLALLMAMLWFMVAKPNLWG